MVEFVKVKSKAFIILEEEIIHEKAKMQDIQLVRTNLKLIKYIVMLCITLIAGDNIAMDNADNDKKYLLQNKRFEKKILDIQNQLQDRSSNNNSIAQDRENRSRKAIDQLQSVKHNIERLNELRGLGSQEELYKLNTQKKKLEAEIAGYEDEFNEFQEEIEDLKNTLINYNTQLDKINLTLNAVESSLSNYDDDSDNAFKTFKKSIAEIEEMLEEGVEAEEEILNQEAIRQATSERLNMSGNSAVGIKIADNNESMSKIVNQELQDMQTSLEKQGLMEEGVEADEKILKQEGIRQTTSERLNVEKGKLYQGVISQLARHRQLQIVSTKVAHNLIIGRLSREGILSAISATEEERGSSRYGIWSSSIYSTYKQKEHGSRSGYMGNMLGGTIGVDYPLYSGLLVGSAYSTMSSRNKHQLGDNRKKYIRQSTDIVSLYSSADLGKDVSIYVIGSISRSKAFKSRSKQLSLESYLNYKINIPSGIIIIPNISIKYNYIMISGYRGKISDNCLLEYSKVNNQILSGEIGSRIMFAPIKLSSDVALTPTAHIAIEKRIVSKGISKLMTLSLQDMWDSSETLSITSYSNHERDGIKIGGGIIDSYKNIILGLFYDMRKQKSYKSHQGVINFKVQL